MLTIMNEFKEASRYACSQLEDYEVAEAMREIGKRMPIPSRIAEKLIDCMEEYGEDNDLPEGWWMEYGDEDEIFFAGTDPDDNGSSTD